MATEALERRSYHHGNLRAALVAAGLELTRVGGPDALVLRDVTRRVGVSPNAAYRHFADRDALLAAVSTAIQEGMAERMRTAVPVAEPGSSDGASARALLRGVGLGYVGFALDEPGWFEVAFDGTVEHRSAAVTPSAPASPDQASADGRLPAPLARLHEALDQLVLAGDLPAADRVGAEWPCWSAVHGFALLALRGPLRGRSRAELWPLAERTVDAIINGLLPASA